MTLGTENRFLIAQENESKNYHGTHQKVGKFFGSWKKYFESNLEKQERKEKKKCAIDIRGQGRG